MTRSLLALTVAVLTGCATYRPPTELVAARVEYTKAEMSETAKLNPAGLYEAKKALDLANQSFVDEPESQDTRDFSYLALRKVQLANAKAHLDRANATKATAQEQKVKATEQRLSQTTEQLKATQELQRKSADQLAKTSEELEKEKAARAEAEKAAQRSADELARIGSVKRDERGVVLSLSGSLLFASNQAVLLPAARAKLDEVASALLRAKSSGFVIEGHTDSVGPDAHNQQLSERRAMAVRDYLVSRNVPAEELKAVGYGEARPVAENETPEGRANNRRVEIVVMPESMLSAR